MSEYVPKPDLEGINAPASQTPFRDALILVTGFLTIACTFYFLLIHVTDWAFTRMNTETEMKLFGKLFAPKANEDEQPDDFKTFVNSMQKATGLPLRVSIVCNENPNAFALPGGSIHLTSGLFSKLKTENGAAFVLAHEVGHFVHRDHIRGLGRQIVFAIGASIFGFGDLTSLGSLDQLIARSFDRNQEADADTYALATVQKMYGHTWGAQEFFEELAKEETTLTNTLSKVASTHPLSSERFNRVRATQTGSPLELEPSPDRFKSWIARCEP